MLLTSITVCCFVLSVQSQLPFDSPFIHPFNKDQLFFADNRPFALPLSIPNVPDKDVIRGIFSVPFQKNTSPSVQIEKSNELASFDQITTGYKSNIDGTSEIPSVATVQQQTQHQQIQKQQQQQEQQLLQQQQKQPQQQQQLLHQQQKQPQQQQQQLLHQQQKQPQQQQKQQQFQQQQLPQHQQKIQQQQLQQQQSQLQQQQEQSEQEEQQEQQEQADTDGQKVPSVILPSPPPQNSNNFLYSVTNFGINLLKNINTVQPGNVVVSPFSITSLLALLQQGASGQTKDQITDALQMTPETAAFSFAQVTSEFKNRNSRNILKTANNLFVANSFSLNPDFKKVALRSFNSDVTPLSFTRPEIAARQINTWVATKTNDKIQKLVTPDVLGATTQVVLVNAVYFKGLWEIPFRVEATIEREFKLSTGQKKTAQYMRVRKMFKTGTDSYTNAKVLMLPFEGNQYSLMIVLPSNLASISETLSSLTDARLLSYLSFPEMETEVEIPKFTVRADTDLTPILRNMGMTNMFGPYAELSGIGTYRTYSPQISSALHSAVLSIDEQGGTAAAATAFAAVALSYDEPSVVFKANRPFIAVLWDTKSSLPLFMAKIEDPQQ